MNINDYFNEFIGYLKSEKNASNHTVKNYETDFKIFNEFMSLNNLEINIEKITTPILRRYIIFLKQDKKYANQTLRRKIHSLSSFFKFLTEQEYIEKNPMLPIHAPKEEERMPIYMTESDIQTLLKTIQREGGEYALAHKCFIKTLIYTGIRRQEALVLDWDDIDFKTQTIKIRKGKGKKERIIPMPDTLTSDLWAYLQTRLPLKNRAVFLSQAGNRLTPTPANALFRRYIEKAGLTGKGYTLHKLRHTYATLLIKNNVDLLSVQKLLGHSDLNSTKIYTHINTDFLKQQVEKIDLK